MLSAIFDRLKVFMRNDSIVLLRNYLMCRLSIFLTVLLYLLVLIQCTCAYCHYWFICCDCTMVRIYLALKHAPLNWVDTCAVSLLWFDLTCDRSMHNCLSWGSCLQGTMGWPVVMWSLLFSFLSYGCPIFNYQWQFCKGSATEFCSKLKKFGFAANQTVPEAWIITIILIIILYIIILKTITDYILTAWFALLDIVFFFTRIGLYRYIPNHFLHKQIL